MRSSARSRCQPSKRLESIALSPCSNRFPQSVNGSRPEACPPTRLDRQPSIRLSQRPRRSPKHASLCHRGRDLRVVAGRDDLGSLALDHRGDCRGDADRPRTAWLTKTWSTAPIASAARRGLRSQDWIDGTNRGQHHQSKSRPHAVAAGGRPAASLGNFL